MARRLFEEIRQAIEKGESETVKALCATTGLSRSTYYRRRLPLVGIPVQMEMRDEIQRIALEFPSYGYRRITAEPGADFQPHYDSAIFFDLDLILRANPFPATHAHHFHAWETGFESLVFEDIQGCVLRQSPGIRRSPRVYLCLW
jgi:hypothetical protein